MVHTAEFLGRLHPLVLHFPLALLIVGSAVEGVRLFRDSVFLGPLGAWMFGLGTSDECILLEWHWWLGLAAAAVSALGRLSAARAGKDRRTLARRGIGLTRDRGGVFDGELVWSRDWLTLTEQHPGE